MCYLSLLFLLLFTMQCDGCYCVQPPCCQYLMAPSTIYVQMDPSAYGIIPHVGSSTDQPSTTTNQHIFANHLQWSVLTDKPWTEGANIYYAVSNHATPESPVINLDQPSLYFMPNWWNKIQQAAGIPNTSPFAIQLNNAAIPVPSDSPISNPIVYHSHPPQDHVETSDEHPRPSATITVVNEEADLLPQSAKEAQELLQQIQSQLQRLNEPKKDEVTKSMEVQSTTQSTTTKQPLTTTTQPTARIVSVENAKITQNQTKSYHVKYDEAPARAPQRKIYSQETEVVEPYRPPNLKIRQHKLENSAKNSFALSTTQILMIFFLFILV